MFTKTDMFVPRVTVQAELAILRGKPDEARRIVECAMVAHNDPTALARLLEWVNEHETLASAAA